MDKESSKSDFGVFEEVILYQAPTVKYGATPPAWKFALENTSSFWMREQESSPETI
jgi:hypothetical protein